ncbi:MULTISPECIES: hypothetical protein [Bradyrhizobium]|uniref:DUF4381 domain-containing protein n=2 Tax=Bradyrhizobium TaxID=374 RepID=A0ABY0PYT0_9BRAD|nr:MULTISPECIES: hypothetical protein [Bradyrhizobium]SDJ17696.1 hypothetical protein SAMN05444163_4752 [Bradyrhizobium ottawaense]SEC84951.1 hypothetical protein SAMN05444171_2411 [Bradyrhizobium lablabi]
MSLQEIFQDIQGWLAELWNYPIPWGMLFLWAAIIIGAMAVFVALAVLTAVFLDRKRKSDAQTPPKTIAELEIECLKVLKYNPHTRDITRVGIVRLNPEGSGPNWTVGKYEPLPSAIGLQIARDLIAGISETFALAD